MTITANDLRKIADAMDAAAATQQEIAFLKSEVARLRGDRNYWKGPDDTRRLAGLLLVNSCYLQISSVLLLPSIKQQREKNVDDKTPDVLAALARDRQNPQWQRVRAGLEKVLPFNLAGYTGQQIKVTGYDRDHVPETFEIRNADAPHCEITITDWDENLDWLAWHLWCAWLRNCT